MIEEAKELKEEEERELAIGYVVELLKRKGALEAELRRVSVKLAKIEKMTPSEVIETYAERHSATPFFDYISARKI